MPVLKNRAYVSTATTGTGTITLGSPVSGYQSFADAGVTNGNSVRYTIEDGANFEIGTGTYTASGTTLSRTPSESSNSGSAINLSGSARVFITAAAEDILQPSNNLSDLNNAATARTNLGFNAGVDAHLNVSTASANEALLWTGSDYSWGTAGASSLNGLSDATADSTTLGLGSGALANDDGSSNYNTAVGISALNTMTSGSGNTAVGNDALKDATTAIHNTAVGLQALTNSITGSRNAALGVGALYTNTTGQDNTAIGHQVLYNNTGNYNTGLGAYALETNTTGGSNSGLGYFSLFANTTGSNNIAVGYAALRKNTTASGNVGIGYQAVHENTEGNKNVGIGYQALYRNTEAVMNTAIGYQALYGSSANTNGHRNTAIGHQALKEISSGTKNTAVGNTAGDAITTGGNNTLLGYNAAASSATVSNEITLGDTNVNRFRIPGLQSSATNGQVMTYNSSSSLIELSDAATGADLYAANPSSATDPTASGANAVAIGDTAVASGTDSLAIGTDTDSTNGSTIALGKGAQATGNVALAVGNSLASGAGTMAIGINNNTSSYGASSLYSIAIGNLAKTTGNNNNIAIGAQASVTAYDYGIAISDADVTGRYGIAIGKQSLAGGERAVNINGGLNSTSNYSVSIGFSSSGNQRSQTTGVGALSLMGSNATGQNSFAAMIGSTNNNNSHGAFAQNAIAIGDSARASQLNSVALGASATSEQIGKFAYSNGKFAADGDAQGGQFILRADTTDATATVLTTNNSTAGSTNQIVAANDTCIMFSGTLVAMQNGAQDQGGWEIKGLLKNDGGTTTLVSSNIQTFDDGNGWVVALTADNTNNALAITCTGEASHNIRWVANIQTSEVTYA